MTEYIKIITQGVQGPKGDPGSVADAGYITTSLPSEPEAEGAVLLGLDNSQNPTIDLCTNGGSVRSYIKDESGSLALRPTHQCKIYVNDLYGGCKIYGVSGGKASISIQPDNVEDGTAGQWIAYTQATESSDNALHLYTNGGDVAKVLEQGQAIFNNFISNSGAPTLTPNTNAGSGAAATLSSMSNDQAGVITLTTGSSASLSGEVLTITPTTTLYKVAALLLTPANAAAATEMSNIFCTVSGAAANINVVTALPTSTVYEFNYMLILSNQLVG